MKTNQLSSRYEMVLTADTPDGDSSLQATIVDLETKKKLAARVTISDADGNFINRRYVTPGFWADGEFEISLKPGIFNINVRCGIEYEPVELELDIIQGKAVEIKFHLKRWVNMPDKGWYAGDSHIHVVHGENQYNVGIPYTALVCRGEGLQYTNLTYMWDSKGAEEIKSDKKLSRDDLAQKIKELYPKERLDSLCRENCTEDFFLNWNLESPKAYLNHEEGNPLSGLCFGHGWTVNMDGYGDRNWLSPPNYEIHEDIHRHGGITLYTHPCRWWITKGKLVSNMAIELPFDTLAGPTYDGLDVMSDAAEDIQNQQLWYTLLNMGYKMPGTASSDSCTDRFYSVLPGIFRTYTHINGPFSFAALAEGIKAGHNFVTSGPFIMFSIGDSLLGDETEATGKKVEGKIEAYTSGDKNERLTIVQLIRNGRVIKSWDLRAQDKRICELTFEIEESETSWYFAKCYGTDDEQVAFTNPIYFVAPGFERPRPVKALVQGRVLDSETRKPVNARIQIINNGEVISQHEVIDGEYQIEIPAASSLKIDQTGYQSITKSILMDCEPIFNLTYNLSNIALCRLETFTTMKRLLRAAKIDFLLEKE